MMTVLSVGYVALRVEVPELVDARERDVFVGVVHDRCALEVAGRKHLRLEVERAPAQMPLGVVEVAVDRAGVDDRALDRRCRRGRSKKSTFSSTSMFG